jgi:hypothetical protein
MFLLGKISIASSDKKFRKLETNQFWQTNFYTPKDNTTKVTKKQLKN